MCDDTTRSFANIRMVCEYARHLQHRLLFYKQLLLEICEKIVIVGLIVGVMITVEHAPPYGYPWLNRAEEVSLVPDWLRGLFMRCNICCLFSLNGDDVTEVGELKWLFVGPWHRHVPTHKGDDQHGNSWVIWMFEAVFDILNWGCMSRWDYNGPSLPEAIAPTTTASTRFIWKYILWSAITPFRTRATTSEDCVQRSLSFLKPHIRRNFVRLEIEWVSWRRIKSSVYSGKVL